MFVPQSHCGRDSFARRAHPGHLGTYYFVDPNVIAINLDNVTGLVQYGRANLPLFVGGVACSVELPQDFILRVRASFTTTRTPPRVSPDLSASPAAIRRLPYPLGPALAQQISALDFPVPLSFLHAMAAQKANTGLIDNGCGGTAYTQVLKQSGAGSTSNSPCRVVSASTSMKTAGQLAASGKDPNLQEILVSTLPACLYQPADPVTGNPTGTSPAPGPAPYQVDGTLTYLVNSYNSTTIVSSPRAGPCAGHVRRY